MKKITKDDKGVVLILGRPNVGKSTLINRILGRSSAITLDTPGVTRDIVRYDATYKQYAFTLLDSAGVLGAEAENALLQHGMESQVDLAIKASDVIVWVTDGTAGIQPVEEILAQRIRGVMAKVVVAVNKCDNEMLANSAPAFYALGVAEVIPISALHGHGIDTLLHYVSNQFGKKSRKKTADAPVDQEDTIAVVGRPNVGKSSLLNALTGKNLALVHDAPGTTRDPIGFPVSIEGHVYTVIDTAGIRRRAKMEDSIEYYAALRATGVLERAGLVVMVVDATDFLVDQDKRVVQMVLDAQKPFVFFVNKWDQTDRTHETRQRLLAHAHKLFPALAYFPTIFGSATSALHLNQLCQALHTLAGTREFRAATPDVNRFVQDVLRRLQPPTMSGNALTIYYGTQVTSAPMRFVFSVNRVRGIPESYKRFLERQLRAYFPLLEGHSVDIVFRNHREPAPA